VKTLNLFCVAFLLCLSSLSYSQEIDKSLTISLFTGAINYQGDLKPNSITLDHSNFSAGLFVRKPISRWFSLRGGFNYGKLEAADEWNRDYLKGRNLSFTTTIKEAYAALELTLFDLAAKRFTPYIYGGIAVFRFNPWATDANGVKTYLKPLSTEGQGLSQFPEQKPYRLTELALPFGGGFRIAVSDAVEVGIEFSQRKTFTDYLDDVSSQYVDRNILLQERGAKAVEMAYRGGQLPQGQPQYPAHGEQRGTPTEKDWYYFGGLTIGVKTDALFSSLFQKNGSVASQRCPRF
jgi:Domain of unknown function (DUF6089)